jgi:hypothetical protein
MNLAEMLALHKKEEPAMAPPLALTGTWWTQGLSIARQPGPTTMT